MKLSDSGNNNNKLPCNITSYRLAMCSHLLYFEHDSSCHLLYQRIYIFVHCDKKEKNTSHNCLSSRSQLAEDVTLSFLYTLYHKCKNSGNMYPICDARGSTVLSISCHFKM